MWKTSFFFSSGAPHWGQIEPHWEVQGHMSITSKRSRVQFQLHPTSKFFITDTHKFSHYCKKTLISLYIYSKCWIIKWSHQMQVLTNISAQNRTLHRLEVILMWPRTSRRGSIWPQCGMPLEKKKLVFRVGMKSAVNIHIAKINCPLITWLLFERCGCATFGISHLGLYSDSHR